MSKLPSRIKRRMTPVPVRDVRIRDSFWRRRIETNRTATLPAEYEQFKRVGTLKAYQWKWPPKKDPGPWRIWVGDLGKWIEAASYALMSCPDPRLEKLAEGVVRGILKGQKKDGFLYSNPIAPGERWTNLQERHQHYDVGHTIEGAAAWYEATGKREFLDAMCRCADLLDANFGPQKGKRRGYDGHQEIELALVKLYRATGEKRYLKLAKFFLDERGRRPYYFDLEKKKANRRNVPLRGWITSYDYCQAHKPVRQQEEAVGHSVRAMYMYSGMADVAAETNDASLMRACRRLWKSATERRMYVIGAVGSTADGERFTSDHDLPNETAYAETCANIALVFFAHRMLQIEADAQYADVMERALYNGVLSGVSLDGKRFFYANHLTVFPRPSGPCRASDHVASVRQEWFGCACCPPNIARLIASFSKYMYSTSRDSLYVHLYAGSATACDVGGGKVEIKQETRYPWEGKVRITVRPEEERTFTVALRIPAWCRKAALRVNGRGMSIGPITKKGYARLRRRWKGGDRIDLDLAMPVERVEAHPAVRMNCGKVAIQRGPVVYCLEEVDNGGNLADIFLPRKSKLRTEYRPRLLGGTVVIRGKAKRRVEADWKGKLYAQASSKRRTVEIQAVPYCLWANRKPGEMMVWVKGA